MIRSPAIGDRPLSPAPLPSLEVWGGVESSHPLILLWSFPAQPPSCSYLGAPPATSHLINTQKTLLSLQRFLESEKLLCQEPGPRPDRYLLYHSVLCALCMSGLHLVLGSDVCSSVHPARDLGWSWYPRNNLRAEWIGPLS